MEAFSLLKYWRGGGGSDTTLDGAANVRTTSTTTGTKTIVTAVSHHTSDTDDDEDDEDDDGPFFDLEFAVPDEDEQAKHEDDGGDGAEEDGDEDNDDNIDSDQSDGEDEREFKFALSSGSSGDRIDPNVSLSPSDDLFFKGRLVPIEPSSLVFNGSEPNSKSQFPVSLLRSATKFRVLMLKFRKSKSNIAEKAESNGSASASPKPQQKQQPESQPQQQNQSQSKFFTVKFKVEEVPIVSLFTRDNSSKGANNKAQKQNPDESASEEKRFSKDVMQRYLKMVKPLYIRVSKRYGEKLGFSGQLSLPGATKAGASPPSKASQKSPPAKTESEPPEITEAPVPSNVKSQKQGNLPAGLRVVCKHLGKSRSASSAAAAAAAAPSGPIASRRHDDSLLQQQDGIQSAILHCKRSFNASRDSESSILSRSVSDPSHEKSMHLSTDSSSEAKETG